MEAQQNNRAVFAQKCLTAPHLPPSCCVMAVVIMGRQQGSTVQCGMADCRVKWPTIRGSG